MATTKNITISINNGTDYDTLYPTCNLANYTGTLPFTSVTGTVPLTQGGTGKTTAPLSLYALINGSTALTSTGLATGDYVGIGDVSAATGKKVTLTNLLTWLSSNMSSSDSGGGIETSVISWTGTGTSTSSANTKTFSTISGYSIFAVFVVATSDAEEWGISSCPIFFNGASGYGSLSMMAVVSSAIRTVTKAFTCSLSGTSVAFPTSVAMEPVFNGSSIVYQAMALYKAS